MTPDFRDPPTPQQIIEARQAHPPQRRAAPLAAWFMLTAVMAAISAVLGAGIAAHSGENLVQALFLIGFGAFCGAVPGGLSGLIDAAPIRGGLLGALMGAIAGAAAFAAALIPGEKFEFAFHTSALAALCIFAAAIMGRWRR